VGGAVARLAVSYQTCLRRPRGDHEVTRSLRDGDHKWSAGQEVRIVQKPNPGGVARIKRAYKLRQQPVEPRERELPGVFLWWSEEWKELVTRQERIDDFIHEGSPPNDQPLQILCEDHVGTYVIPFPCRWRDGIWENAKTSRRIEATVVGWRALNKTQR